RREAHRIVDVTTDFFESGRFAAVQRENYGARTAAAAAIYGAKNIKGENISQEEAGEILEVSKAGLRKAWKEMRKELDEEMLCERIS
ncbi:MAG: hypothetical protein ABEJ03_02820, partial [Candidatus Nanohaloarchaea archaeon]